MVSVSETSIFASFAAIDRCTATQKGFMKAPKCFLSLLCSHLYGSLAKEHVQTPPHFFQCFFVTLSYLLTLEPTLLSLEQVQPPTLFATTSCQPTSCSHPRRTTLTATKSRNATKAMEVDTSPMPYRTRSTTKRARSPSSPTQYDRPSVRGYGFKHTITHVDSCD